MPAIDQTFGEYLHQENDIYILDTVNPEIKKMVLDNLLSQTNHDANGAINGLGFLDVLAMKRDLNIYKPAIQAKNDLARIIKKHQLESLPPMDYLSEVKQGIADLAYPIIALAEKEPDKLDGRSMDMLKQVMDSYVQLIETMTNWICTYVKIEEDIQSLRFEKCNEGYNVQISTA